MHPRKLVITSTLSLAATLLACGDTTPQDRATAGASTADARSSASVASLVPDSVLDRLKARYAVLRAESAPPPQPSVDANPADVPDRWRDRLSAKVLASATGEATFYADTFEGRRTASGIPFRQNQMVAAHRGYPFGTILRVTNLGNDRSVNVRVVDRGPFGRHADAGRRILDLSKRAAQQLDYINAGRTQVKVEVLEWGKGMRLG